MLRRNDVWIRVAGSSERIRARDPRHWRCYVDPDLTEIPLRGCVLAGTASPANALSETNPDRDERGLIAWLRYYGDVRIEGDIAYIQLKEPPR